MMRRRISLKPWISLVSAMVLLNGCVDVGVGGGSGDGDAPKQEAQKKKAYYIDEPIANIDYKCGKYEGKTDSSGAFFFEDGVLCSFSIGNMKLREIDSSKLKDNVSIIESDGVTAALLQSLDNDGMEDGSIDIDDEVRDLINSNNIQTPPQTDQERADLIDIINKTLKPEIPYVAKSKEEALKHLRETIKIYGGDDTILTTPIDENNDNGNDEDNTDNSGDDTDGNNQNGNNGNNDNNIDLTNIGNNDGDDFGVDTKVNKRDTDLNDNNDNMGDFPDFGGRDRYTPKTPTRPTPKEPRDFGNDGDNGDKKTNIDTPKDHTDNTDAKNPRDNDKPKKRKSDRTKPEITLKGSKKMTVEVGSRFRDPGARATDDVDGDITDRIRTRGRVDTSREGTYKITYTVKDSAGNRATVTREVVVKAKAKKNTPPVVKLIGPKEIYITVGDRYIEYGAEATDAEDGELPVTITKKIDTSRASTTVVKYRATDSAGSTKEALRLVVVEEAKRGKVKLPMTPLLTDAKKRELLDAVNSIRSESQTCGDGTVMPAVSPLKWSDKLYKTAYAHSLDRDMNNLTGYPGWKGSGTPRDPAGYNKNKRSTYTERIPTSGYAAGEMAEVTGEYQGSILKSLQAYISNENSVRACKDIMSPKVKDVGIAVAGKYFTVDMAAPLIKGDAVNLKTFVVYDDSAITKYGSVSAVKTRINHLFSAANTAYRNSTLQVHMKPVGFEKYTKSNGKSLQDALTILGQDKNFQYMDGYGNKPDNKRNRAKAHHVMLMKGKSSNYGLCGLGYQLTDTRAYKPQNKSFLASMMFSAVYMNCFDRVAVHEIGHNFGLRHSHRQDGDENVKPYNYALGHGVKDTFVTIMAYKMEFGRAQEPLKFSSPKYECAPSIPCGIPVGEPGEADAVKLILHAAPIIEKLY